MDSVDIKSESDIDLDSDSDDLSMQTDVWDEVENIEESEENPIKILPERSRKKYEAAYKAFTDWRLKENIGSLSEKVLLKYFDELSEKYKASSLWAIYSMLRSTIIYNHNVNIETYTQLHSFLKRKSQGYVAKKGKAFTLDEINKFLSEAPDNRYLAMKAALVMGTMGACRSNQLYSLKMEHVQDIGTALLVSLPFKNDDKVIRKFTVTGQYYEICKRYINLRPPECPCNAFFLMYADGKCSPKNLGINKLGNFGKQIAMFLKLPTPEMYTGHCFRKSSGTLLVDAEGDIITIKRHHRWKPASVVEAANTILQLEDPRPPTDPLETPTTTHNTNNIRSNTNNTTNNTTQEENVSSSSIPTLHIINSSNITINFYINRDDKDM